jgi:hypothetical protein
LPRFTTYFGPRTEDAGFIGITWPVTNQSKSIRIAARCCFTVGAAPGWFWMLAVSSGSLHGRTWNFTLLFSVPPGPVTVTKPLVAPVGTVAVIKVGDLTVNAAE